MKFKHKEDQIEETQDVAIEVAKPKKKGRPSLRAKIAEAKLQGKKAEEIEAEITEADIQIGKKVSEVLEESEPIEIEETPKRAKKIKVAEKQPQVEVHVVCGNCAHKSILSKLTAEVEKFDRCPKCYAKGHLKAFVPQGYLITLVTKIEAEDEEVALDILIDKMQANKFTYELKKAKDEERSIDIFLE